MRTTGERSRQWPDMHVSQDMSKTGKARGRGQGRPRSRTVQEPECQGLAVINHISGMGDYQINTSLSIAQDSSIAQHSAERV